MIYGVIAPQWSSIRKLHEHSQSSLIAASISSGPGQMIIIVGMRAVPLTGVSVVRDCARSCLAANVIPQGCANRADTPRRISRSEGLIDWYA